MVRRSKDVTDTELAVMEVLWHAPGACTTREITDHLYPTTSPSELATVQTLLARLMKKGFVSRRKKEGLLAFAPRQSRDELIARRLQMLADSLCGGSLRPLLSNLVQKAPLSPEERDRLRELVQTLEAPAEEDER